MESAVATMMVAESQSCNGNGIASSPPPSLPRTSVRSMSAPVTPSLASNCGGGGGSDNEADTSSRTCSGKSDVVAAAAARRVTFPVVEVTGIVEPPNPWHKAVGVTSTDVVIAYVAACDRYQVMPVDKVIQQVQRIENFEKRVSNLDLRSEELDAGRIEALEEIFKRVQFYTINLENAVLSEEGATALFDMIEYYESVQHLIISRNKGFSLRGWQGFCRMIKSTRCLGELELSGIPIGDNMNIVARTLKSCSNLATLHLENCNLSGKYFSILMNCLVMNNSLRELYVANNRLSSTDATQIGNYLKKNSKLRLLHLGNNQLEDVGIGHIADGLSDQSAGVFRGGLTTLVVHNNHLSNKSTRHVAQLLSDCRSLTALDIGQNNLNNEFIHSVKDPLIRNHTLTNLCLKGCRISCVGAVALAEYIADSSSIQLMDLRDNNIKIGGLMALTHSMEVNASVTKLQLDGVSLKEQLEDPEHRHQDLLFEIAGYCERNSASHEKRRAEDEAAAAFKEEVLSEPVTRLLSLWSNQPPMRKTVRSASVVNPPPPPPPITISAIAETPTEAADQQSMTTHSLDETSGWQMVRGTSHFLRSPQPSPSCSPIPSPTKNRFRVTRVFQEADSAAKKVNHPTGGHSPLPSTSAATVAAASGRFNKFTVTPVRTINGVDALIPTSSSSGSKLVQRKSDSDLFSSMSSSNESNHDRSSQLEVQRRLDVATSTDSTSAAGEDFNGLCSSVGGGEEEGEDSVFLDVPAVGPNQRVRHDSMRVHRRRLSNGDDLNKQTLEPLLKQLASTALAADDDDRGGGGGGGGGDDDDDQVDVSESESLDQNSAHEKFGLQNAVDSMEINTLKAGFLRDLLQSQSSSPRLSSFVTVDENTEYVSTGARNDGDYDEENTPTSLTSKEEDVFSADCAEDDDDDDDPSSGGDRDSGIYLLDAGGDELGTPRSEQSEEENNGLEEQCAKKADAEAKNSDACEGKEVEEEEDVDDETDQVTPSPSSSGISFNLVDIGENDHYFKMASNREYAGSWLQVTDGRSVHNDENGSDMFRGSSANSLVDLLTGGSGCGDDEDDEWKCSPVVVATANVDCVDRECGGGGDLMLFIEKDAVAAILESDGEMIVADGDDVYAVHLTNACDSAEAGDSAAGDVVTEVVSAWISRNAASEWTADEDHHSHDHDVDGQPQTDGQPPPACSSSPAQQQQQQPPPKNVENLLPSRIIGPCGSESSNSSDSGVPESPMSCSPPVVDPARNSPSRRKTTAVLSANGVGLGLDVLERLDLRNSMPISPGHVIQSRGLMDMAAEFLMSREGLNGVMENRREAASGCLGLSKLSSTVGHGIAKEATTST